jgi:hypothetical protein
MQPWIIGALVTIGLFLIGHLGGAIWFASRVSTEMRALVADLQKLTGDVRAIATQNQQIAVLDRRILTLEEDCRETRAALRSIGRYPGGER